MKAVINLAKKIIFKLTGRSILALFPVKRLSLESIGRQTQRGVNYNYFYFRPGKAYVPCKLARTQLSLFLCLLFGSFIFKKDLVYFIPKCPP